MDRGRGTTQGGGLEKRIEKRTNTGAGWGGGLKKKKRQGRLLKRGGCCNHPGGKVMEKKKVVTEKKETWGGPSKSLFCGGVEIWEQTFWPRKGLGG